MVFTLGSYITWVTIQFEANFQIASRIDLLNLVNTISSQYCQFLALAVNGRKKIEHWTRFLFATDEIRLLEDQ